MAASVDIGSLISRRPEIPGARPCIAGTGVSVRRIAVWHKPGNNPEEILRNFPRVSLAHIYAAYYYANQAEVDADLEAVERLADEVEKRHGHKPKCA